ncbi:hypothetical protein PVAND_015444 [Polypedilum vanderplanki]|uniref:Peptidase S1 domain-containing protein n=1 Tax=Polypedilum vanderplanki TaxID=319348 RepID=A0A9J6BD12_POLVA|nr:hypothetical protein PVAND_015444 [Polypedilum vanderplanki]
MFNFYVQLKANDCGKVQIETPELKIFDKNLQNSIPGQWPWVVSLLLIDNNFICGSSLISKKHLLSVAHCIQFGNFTLQPRSLYALLGRHNLSDETEENWIKSNISEIFVHSDYNKSSRSFRSKADISILVLKKVVIFTKFIQPICLPQSTVNTINIDGFVIGYGQNSEDEKPREIAKYFVMHSINPWDCSLLNRSYSKIISRDSFCARNENAALCPGDSGSGFEIKNSKSFTLYGLVSQCLNSTNCNPDDYTVFVDVAKYIHWIYEKTGLKAIVRIVTILHRIERKFKNKIHFFTEDKIA